MFRTVSSNILCASRSRMGRYWINSRTFTDGWKGVTDLLNRGTKKATEAVKKTTDKTLDALEAQAKKASQNLSAEAHKAFEKGSSRASESLHRSSVMASEALAKSKSSAEDVLRSSSRKVLDQIHLATRATVKTSNQVASQTGEALWNKSTQVAKSTSERIRKSSLGVLTNVQEFAQKAIRWFFWWSLAAIGVYGIATSVPSALIRYSFSGRRGSNQEELLAQQVPNASTTAVVVDHSSQDKGWMRWISSGSRSAEENNIPCENTPASSSNGYLSLPWNNSPGKKD